MPLVWRAALLGSGPPGPGLVDAQSWSMALSVICLLGYGVADVVFTMWRGQVHVDAIGAGMRRGPERRFWRGWRDRQLHDVWRYFVGWAPGRKVPPIDMWGLAWRTAILARTGMVLLDTARTPLGLVAAAIIWTVGAIGGVAAVVSVVAVVRRIEAARAASRGGRA
ncbi:hypothetical protein WEH80_28880 [Actinomycetes bacterium KLBMP 9759]